VVRCALPAGQTISRKDNSGNSYSFTGEIGLAPAWATGSCNTTCEEDVSACVLAHVNTTGQHISLWMDSVNPALGWGRSANFPYQEGSFFGNIFHNPPVAYYCNGADYDYGVVPGRLGANQTNAPYKNPNGSSALCTSLCSPTGGAANNDGFGTCFGAGGVQYHRIVTVYRNFDPTVQYKICDRISGQCLATSNSTAGGQIVRQTYGSAGAQKWTITQTAAGKYKVLNVQTGMALDMAGSKTGLGTMVVQAAYTGTATQQWAFKSVADGTGFFQIQPSSTTLNAIGSVNSNIDLESWGWIDDQKWSVQLAN